MGLGDIDVIEESLRLRLTSLSHKDLAEGESINSINSEIQKIQNVLGHLHNQKNWYRPKDKVYVSGWFEILLLYLMYKIPPSLFFWKYFLMFSYKEFLGENIAF